MESKELREAKENFNRLYKNIDGFLATGSFDDDIVAIMDWDYVNDPNLKKIIPRYFDTFPVIRHYEDAEFILSHIESNPDGVFVGMPVRSRVIELDEPLNIDTSNVQIFDIRG